MRLESYRPYGLFLFQPKISNSTFAFRFDVPNTVYSAIWLHNPVEKKFTMATVHEDVQCFNYTRITPCKQAALTLQFTLSAAFSILYIFLNFSINFMCAFVAQWRGIRLANREFSGSIPGQAKVFFFLNYKCKKNVVMSSEQCGP